MKQTKTAKGRVIDMAALVKQNEEVRAVGNTPMNARGDRLDASGNVIATVQAVARTQAELKTAPEKRKLSDAPGNKQTRKKKIVADVPTGPVEMSREEKTRDDGTRYVEIEYDDGSMDVQELKTETK